MCPSGRVSLITRDGKAYGWRFLILQHSGINRAPFTPHFLPHFLTPRCKNEQHYSLHPPPDSMSPYPQLELIWIAACAGPRRVVLYLSHSSLTSPPSLPPLIGCHAAMTLRPCRSSFSIHTTSSRLSSLHTSPHDSGSRFTFSFHVSRTFRLGAGVSLSSVWRVGASINCYVHPSMSFHP